VAQIPKKLTAEQRKAIMKLLAKKKGVDTNQIRSQIAQVMKGGTPIPQYASKGGYINKKKKECDKKCH